MTATHIKPTAHFVKCKGREIHYLEWGQPASPAVVLWHGLARTCRDFDDLAASLADSFRVIVPDTIGRGMSEWSTRPDEEYCFEFYAEIVEDLVEKLSLPEFSWLGTSMGGGLGIRVAGGRLAPRIRHLVLNDMSPEPSRDSLMRIRNYIGSPPVFDTVSEFETYCRGVYTPFGWHSDAQWRHMATTSMRRREDGRVTTHYDPRIVQQLFNHLDDDFCQWEAFSRIKASILLLRGESSDLVLPDQVPRMRALQPAMQVIEVPGCGHAPALNVDAQIGMVRKFFGAVN
ncbi:alpha/beta fold hydrolase [Variovorax sp. VNK109]|uniref:alpha/beta fold hydrolase n=1 Tax=Variovorax sp. VNK109 TaxID=3400919 RepID=UPI003C0EF414